MFTCYLLPKTISCFATQQRRLQAWKLFIIKNSLKQSSDPCWSLQHSGLFSHLSTSEGQRQTVTLSWRISWFSFYSTLVYNLSTYVHHRVPEVPDFSHSADILLLIGVCDGLYQKWCSHYYAGLSRLGCIYGIFQLVIIIVIIIISIIIIYQLIPMFSICSCTNSEENSSAALFTCLWQKRTKSEFHYMELI